MRRFTSAVQAFVRRVRWPSGTPVRIANHPAAARGPLYIYFDESGDLNFKGFGTGHFLCGVLITADPWALDRRLNATREKVYRGGFVKESFHASEELQATRDVVFRSICETGGFEYHVAVVEKATIPPAYQDDTTFYTLIADFTLRLALQYHPSAQPLFLITDRLPVKQKQNAIVKGFKNCLAELAGERRYEIGHHSAAAHPCLQAADYMNWAIYRKWERGDFRSYDLIKSFVRQEVRLDGAILDGAKK